MARAKNSHSGQGDDGNSSHDDEDPDVIVIDDSDDPAGSPNPGPPWACMVGPGQSAEELKKRRHLRQK